MTYIVKIVYSATHRVEVIKLISLSHGQLETAFTGANILTASRRVVGNVRQCIRFKEDNIIAVSNWRVNEIFKRH